jgi:hypothetical protein
LFRLFGQLATALFDWQFQELPPLLERRRLPIRFLNHDCLNPNHCKVAR